MNNPTQPTRFDSAYAIISQSVKLKLEFNTISELVKHFWSKSFYDFDLYSQQIMYQNIKYRYKVVDKNSIRKYLKFLSKRENFNNSFTL